MKRPAILPLSVLMLVSACASTVRRAPGFDEAKYRQDADDCRHQAKAALPYTAGDISGGVLSTLASGALGFFIGAPVIVPDSMGEKQEARERFVQQCLTARGYEFQTSADADREWCSAHPERDTPLARLRCGKADEK